MTPLAIIAKEAGFYVSGSDLAEEFITDDPLRRKGIEPLIGFSEDHLKGADLVVTTGAHGGFENIEVITARKKNIPVWTQGQTVGEFMKGEIFGKNFVGISVAGSHGKTTTTAMLATILSVANLDPSFLIGTGNIDSLGLPGHFGKGKYFISEADEYITEPKFDKTPKFLWQHPNLAIFTNIEYDHPDIYKSVDQVRNSFLAFAGNIRKNGILIANGDDSELRILLKDYKGEKITFGFSPNNNYVIHKITIEEERTFFWVNAYGTSQGQFSLNITGDFNALNALGAVVAAVEIGLPINKIKTGLSRFTGSKRRLEFIGRLRSGAMVFDDYAHHPTEIKKTLKAIRSSYPKAKIVCIFQPHTYSRTKALFDKFIRCFSDADTIIFTDIYSSLREEKDETISSKILAEKTSAVHKESIFLPELSDVVEYIDQKEFPYSTIIVTMGAGDIYKISERLKFKT